MSVRRNFSRRQRRNFAYHFQVADSAMQMDVHKTLYTFYPISLYWLDINSQSFVWNVFYTSAIRNAFSLNKLPNIHFFEHYLQISHNLKTINGQNNMEAIINDSVCSKIRRHATFRSWLFSQSTHWQRPRSLQ